MTKERLQSELQNLSQQKLEASFQLQLAKEHLKQREDVLAGVDGAILIVSRLVQEEAQSVSDDSVTTS